MTGRAWDDEQERFVPLKNKSLEPNADGDLLLDDPNLDRVGNIVRYMRQHPAYTRPNRSPKSMLLLALSKGILLRAGVIEMDKYVELTDDKLWEDYEDADMIVFMPSLTQCSTATEAKQILDLFYSQSSETIEHSLRYLINNRWFMKR